MYFSFTLLRARDGPVDADAVGMDSAVRRLPALRHKPQSNVQILPVRRFATAQKVGYVESGGMADLVEGGGLEKRFKAFL